MLARHPHKVKSWQPNPGLVVWHNYRLSSLNMGELVQNVEHIIEGVPPTMKTRARQVVQKLKGNSIATPRLLGIRRKARF